MGHPTKGWGTRQTPEAAISGRAVLTSAQPLLQRPSAIRADTVRQGAVGLKETLHGDPL